jgi:hypothetical protein
MKRIFSFIFVICIFISCKSFFKGSNSGSFRIINSSNKIIEFIWIAPEGEFYPTAKSINIGKNETYEVQGLDGGYYDIAIDFKNEYNSFNSKKNKELVLTIEKGLSTVWLVDPSGEVIR